MITEKHCSNFSKAVQEAVFLPFDCVFAASAELSLESSVICVSEQHWNGPTCWGEEVTADFTGSGGQDPWPSMADLQLFISLFS